MNIRAKAGRPLPAPIKIGAIVAKPTPRPPPNVAAQTGVNIPDTTDPTCTTQDFVLLQIEGWPEVETVMELKCVTLFQKTMCTNVPVVYHRTSTLQLIAAITYPTTILSDIQAAVNGAIAAGVIAGGITLAETSETGGAAATAALAAATATFKQWLIVSLTAIGAAGVSKVEVGLFTETVNQTPWEALT